MRAVRADGVRKSTVGRIESRAFQPDKQESDMGSGDVRTRRGKIKNGSYGNTRPGRAKKAATPARGTVKQKSR